VKAREFRLGVKRINVRRAAIGKKVDYAFRASGVLGRMGRQRGIARQSRARSGGKTR